MECVLPELGTLTIALERVDAGGAGSADALAPDMRFKVEIIRAEGVVAMDMGGTSDAFCQLYCGFKSVGTTTTKMKTLSPEWGETFTVDFTGENRSKPLGVTVLDYDMISPLDGEFLGKLQISNADLVAAWKQKTRWEKDCKLMPHFPTQGLHRFFSVVKGFGSCACLSNQSRCESTKLRRQPSVYGRAVGLAQGGTPEEDVLAMAVETMSKSVGCCALLDLLGDTGDTDEDLAAVFNSMDHDGSGDVTVEELKAHFAHNKSGSSADEQEQQMLAIIERADADKSGSISLEEFFKYARASKDEHRAAKGATGAVSGQQHKQKQTQQQEHCRHPQQHPRMPLEEQQYEEPRDTRPFAMLRARPAAETAYGDRVATAAKDGQLVFQTDAFTYCDSTGQLPDCVRLEVSVAGFSVLPPSAVAGSSVASSRAGGALLELAVWGRTEFEVHESADPKEMDLFLVT
jgi:hypothetical protein